MPHIEQCGDHRVVGRDRPLATQQLVMIEQHVRSRQRIDVEDAGMDTIHGAGNRVVIRIV